MLRYETQPAVRQRRSGKLDRVVQVVKRVRFTRIGSQRAKLLLAPVKTSAPQENWFAVLRIA